MLEPISIKEFRATAAAKALFCLFQEAKVKRLRVNIHTLSPNSILFPYSAHSLSRRLSSTNVARVVTLVGANWQSHGTARCARSCHVWSQGHLVTRVIRVIFCEVGGDVMICRYLSTQKGTMGIHRIKNRSSPISAN